MSHGNQQADKLTFKRLNFFNGFFTTADDWNDGEKYHLAKRRLHNRALHTPGILYGEGGELKVTALGGLTVRVAGGAALDCHGNIIGVPNTTVLKLGEDSGAAADETITIYVKFDEVPDDHYENSEEPEFSGDRRMLERPVVGFMRGLPDNQECLELARVNLTAGSRKISDPGDPNHPLDNEIDSTHRVPAGSIGARPPRLDPETQRTLHTLMLDLRENSAALAARFAAPSLDDVRGAALHVRLLTAQLEPSQLPDALRLIADIEQDVGEELAVRCPPLLQKAEHQTYQACVAALLASLAQGPEQDPATLLNDQAEINSAVRDLAEVVFPPPKADAGDDQRVETLDTYARVTLDASRSQAATGQRIVRYIWEEVEA